MTIEINPYNSIIKLCLHVSEVNKFSSDFLASLANLAVKIEPEKTSFASF